MSRGRDRGGALVGALVLVTLAAAVTVPLVDALVAVRAHGAAAAEWARRAEAVRSAGRLALGDPRSLFAVCAGADAADPVDISHHDVTVGGSEPLVVHTSCVERSVVTAVDDERVVVTLTGVGAVLPGGITAAAEQRVVVFSADHDPGSEVFPEEFWLAFPITDAPEPDSIWLPPLPVRPDEAPPPVADPNGCTIWYPGGYPAVDDDDDGMADPLVLMGAHYFASGVYHLERPLVLGAGAQVVVGSGATRGCSSDAVARTGAGGSTVQGLGATIVFGGAGALVLDAVGSGDVGRPASFVVERRITPAGDPNAHLDGVAVMAVSGSPELGAVLLPGLLAVPESRVAVLPPGGEPVAYVADAGYTAVEGVPPCTADPVTGQCTGPLEAAGPLVDLRSVGPSTVRVEICGALVAPQSRITLAGALSGGSLDVLVEGSLIAASIDVDGAPAPTLPAGVAMRIESGAGRVVQRTLRLQSIVAGDGPNITSTIDVQVNETAVHAVTSWRLG